MIRGYVDAVGVCEAEGQLVQRESNIANSLEESRFIDLGRGDLEGEGRTGGYG